MKKRVKFTTFVALTTSLVFAGILGLKWHERHSPTYILNDAYRCYRNQDEACIKALIDNSTIGESFSPEAYARLKEGGASDSKGLLKLVAHPVFEKTVEHMLISAMKNPETRKQVASIEPWQMRAFMLYPHSNGLDISSETVAENLYELTIMEEEKNRHYKLLVSRGTHHWRVKAIDPAVIPVLLSHDKSA